MVKHLTGMRRKAHVRANCAAWDGKLLTPDEFHRIEKHKFVHGWPYPWAAK